jgi:hypothetical protein
LFAQQSAGLDVQCSFEQVEILRLKKGAKGVAAGLPPGGKAAPPAKKGTAPVAAVPPPEDLEPLCLLTPRDAADLVLLELGLRTAEPIPPNLENVQEAAGENEAAGSGSVSQEESRRPWAGANIESHSM